MEIPARPPLVVCGLEGVFAPPVGAAAQPCDLACAQLFCAVGGRLAVFTHRAPAAVRAVLGPRAINLPAATCGGALLYDLGRDCMVQSRPISIQAGKALLQFALAELPHAGVVGVTDQGQTYLLRASREAQMLLNREAGPYGVIPPEQAGRSWCKLSICAPAKAMARAGAYLKSRPDLPLTVLRQEPFALEIVAAQVQPQETMRRLCGLAGCVQQQAVAVMAQAQDTAWAAHTGRVLVMGDAPAALKKLAHDVLWPYRNGGLGEYLYRQAALLGGTL